MGGDSLIKGMSKSKSDGIVTYDYFNDQIEKGLMFAIAKRFKIGGEAVLDLVLDPTAYAGDGLIFLPVAYKATGGPVLIDFYAGTDADADGTLLVPTNRSLLSSNTTDMVWRSGATVNTAGTAGGEFLVPSDGLAASAKAGGESQGDLITILNPAIKYLLRITNSDSTEETIHVTLNWIEK